MKKFKGISLIFVLVGLLLTVTACTKEEIKTPEVNNKPEIEETNFAEVEDIYGNKVVFKEEPKKIVSLGPSNVEIIYALDAGDKLVGRNSAANYPEDVNNIEIVGDYNGNNLERIIELNPDVVFVYGPGNENENKILKDAGISVLGFLSETIDAVMNEIEVVGKVTGKSKEAKDLIDNMNSKKIEILDKVKEQEEITVFYEIWHDPIMAAGKGSFMDELITLARGKNIANDTEGAYPQYDLEQLLERNPQVFLAAKDMPEKTIESIKIRPGFDAISAIQNDKVYLFEGIEADLVSRPGPRIIDALEVVAKAIHPEIFK